MRPWFWIFGIAILLVSIIIGIWFWADPKVSKDDIKLDYSSGTGTGFLDEENDTNSGEGQEEGLASSDFNEMNTLHGN